MADPDIFWPMLAPWLGPDDARIERSAVYTFHSLIQEGWRHGRLLLAGDACHQTPPFLGQGMCAGMRDAANLSWKLAAVLRGEAPESLLDTYESERLPHVRAFIELAVQLGNVIQATDSGSVAERERRFAARPEVFDFPRPQLGPGYRLDAPPPVGTIFPQPRLADGRLMDEAIGQRFAVIGEAALIEGPRNDVIALPGVGTDWLAEHDAKAAIIRPDRYVFAVARNRDELDAALRVLATRTSSPGGAKRRLEG